MPATLLPPIAVNACEADAVAGARCTYGATYVTLHPVELQLPASASWGETIASKRNETRRRRRIIFIVGRGCVPYYLLSGKSTTKASAFELNPKSAIESPVLDRFAYMFGGDRIA